MMNWITDTKGVILRESEGNTAFPEEWMVPDPVDTQE